MTTGSCEGQGVDFSISVPAHIPTPQMPPEGYDLPTLERVQREIGTVLQLELSPRVLPWVQGYGRVGRRNLFLWKFARHGVQLTSLPCVSAELLGEVCDTKVLGVILDVLLDDVADMRGSTDLLDQLLSLPFGRTQFDFAQVSAKERVYAQFTVEVWHEIQRRAQTFPCYGEYKDVLRYDYIQLMNVMRYSHLVNGNLKLLNLAEHDLYTPHNMHMMCNATLDLMCSPHIDRSEVGRLREAAWHGQCMGRMGNLNTTWEREVHERDFSAGVYARAVSRGDLTVDQLEHGNPEEIKAAIRNGGHERYFWKCWQEHRQAILSLRPHVRSCDLAKYAFGLEGFVSLNIGSRGYK